MTQLQQATDELEQQLRAGHPHLAAYLDLMLEPHKIWGGGWLVLGEIYANQEQAHEARRAAVMAKLVEVDGAVL
jgi:cytochrome c-type biogenesis protein CcmH/NrfG